MASPQDNEAAIRVQLSLLNAQDSASATQLANSLKEISKMFEALRSSDFRESATKMAQLHRQMVLDTQMMQQKAADQRMQGLGSGVTRMATMLTPPSNEALAAAADPVRAAAEARREQVARQETERRQKERERLDMLQGMTDAERAAQHRRERYNEAIPSLGSPGQNPGAWYNRVQSLNPEAATGFRIPQFGNITMQDVLAQARDRALMRAEKASQGLAPSGDFERYGNAAARIDRASQWAGNAYAAREGYRRLSGFAGAQGFSVSGMDAGGAALGYRRDSNAFSDIFGMQTPFSAAGQQGLRQSLDIQRLRMSAGINKQEAASIVGAAAGAGFSGEQGSMVARDFMAPLFRQFQIDPSQLAAHLQVIRTGTATLGALSKELADIGEVARTAMVDVNTMNQALVQAGEASQALGGTYMGGVRFGRTFTQSTGLLPGVGQNVLQNSTTQAMLSGATGLPGFALGSASTGAKMQSIQQSMRMYYNAYKGALGTKGDRAPILDASGNILGYDEGTNPAMAALGAKYGISGDEAEKLMRGQDTASRLTTLNTALDAYGRDASNAGNKQDFDSARKWVEDMGPDYRVNPQTGRVEHRRRQIAGRAGRTGPDIWEGDDDRTKEFNRRTATTATRLLKTTGADQIGEDDIRIAARDAGLNGHLVAKAIREGKTAEEQIANVRKLADEKSAQDRAKYEIAFTGPAAKFFKALAKKSGMEDQYNELPSNIAAASARGSSPLSPLSNAAQAVNPTRPG